MVTMPVAAQVSIQSVLFATDLSSVSEHALKYAAAIAAMGKSKLFVVHALPLTTPSPSSDFGVHAFDPHFRQAENHIRGLENSGAMANVEHSVILEQGGVWEVLAKIIAKNKIDLIVLGTHARAGIKKLVFGSVAEEVLRLAPCPVLTIGSHIEDHAPAFGFRPILLATDYSSGSLHALSYALLFAQLFKAKAMLVHALDPLKIEWSGQIERLLAQEEKKLETLVTQCQVEVDFQVKLGVPVDVILEVAKKENAELIVMGAHQTRTIGVSTHLPWTVAHHIVSHASCPVLTVRSQDQR